MLLGVPESVPVVLSDRPGGIEPEEMDHVEAPIAPVEANDWENTTP
jgi:hypothetical protein